MLDAGCGVDPIGLGDLSRGDKKMIVQNAEIGLRTANGKTKSYEKYACFGHRRVN